MDDESRGVVNSFYDQLKGESSKRGIDYTQFERQKQTELKKKFQIKVGEMFKNSDGSSEAYAKSRALILYSKFKFSYAD